VGISNPVHLAFIAIVALLVLGPKRLPELARSLGNGMREFRESLNAATQDDEPELARSVAQPVADPPPPVAPPPATPPPSSP
jgi:sec-independent protein translocase protein TatA